MKTIAQVLPPDTIDSVLQQVAPADVKNEELLQFKTYLEKAGSKTLGSLVEEMKGAARIRARKILLREQLLQRLGTDWLRKQQEMVEAELAKVEVARDTVDFNILELELTGRDWRLGRNSKVLRLDEQAGLDPVIGMIKSQQDEDVTEAMSIDGGVDDEKLENLFGLGAQGS